jgi:hypothetical protein
MKKHVLLIFVALWIAATAGGCSHVPPANPGEASNVSTQERIRRAIRLLEQGNPHDARLDLQAVLVEKPRHRTARHLLKQIETKPEVLLGKQSRAYVVGPGDTMSGLAQRFLGDPLLFYALARYSGVNVPDQLAAGQSLRIPERPTSAVTLRPQVDDEEEQDQTEDAAETDFSSSQSPAITAAVNADPQGANRRRLEALEKLNRGEVDDAVALLREAHTLDGNNVLVKKDLDRAIRLQASLR